MAIVVNGRTNYVGTIGSSERQGHSSGLMLMAESLQAIGCKPLASLAQADVSCVCQTKKLSIISYFGAQLLKNVGIGFWIWSL